MTQFESSDFDPNAEQLFIEPPGWPKVIGIMSIIFGSLSVFCGGIQAVAAPFQGSMVEPMLNGDPMPPGYSFDAVMIGLAIGGGAVNVLLLVAGILLVNRRAAARLAHLVYALLLIPLTVLSGLNGMKVMAAQQDWAKLYPSNDFAKQMTAAGDISATIGTVILLLVILLSLAWPLFCIIWFGLVKTKLRHMTGQPEEEHDPMAA
ncbi:MAG: small-conductance mechanosensitive channel [Phycisphaerales bacterium]|jgi:small-conductance mechanosensitive channel